MSPKTKICPVAQFNLAQTCGERILKLTVWGMVISCVFILPTFASDSAWSYVLDYRAEGTTQNKSLTLGEWGRAGCTYLPAPAVCYETISIETRVYFGRKTNIKSNKKLIWVLFDYSQRSNENDQSDARYIEVDCERWAYLELARYEYDQPMGNGRAKLKAVPKELNYPAPNTAFLKILQAACER